MFPRAGRRGAVGKASRTHCVTVSMADSAAAVLLGSEPLACRRKSPVTTAGGDGGDQRQAPVPTVEDGGVPSD